MGASADTGKAIHAYLLSLLVHNVMGMEEVVLGVISKEGNVSLLHSLFLVAKEEY